MVLSFVLFFFCRFYLRETQSDVPWLDNYGLDPQILRDFLPFLLQPENREYPDLCQLPGECHKLSFPENVITQKKNCFPFRFK
jgi:hypothetical protein